MLSPLRPVLETTQKYGYAQGAFIEKGVKEAIGRLLVKFGSVGRDPLVGDVTLDEMAERYRKAGI